MRLLAVWFVLLASGCSGKSPEREAWERQIDGVRTLLRLQNVQYVDMDWVATGRRDGTVVEQRDCPDGGEALLYEDDTVEFLDCIMDSENNYSGRIVFSDDASGRSRFVYEEFQGLMGGYPFFMDGGYYTSDTEGGGVRVEADLELREADPGEGETTTRFTADIVFDVEGKTISGTVDISTQSSTGETNPYLDTSCSFEDRPLDLFVALGKADFNLFERVCPQKWDEEVDLQVRVRHKHDGDDDPIHIMGPGEGFDGSTKVRSGGSDGRSYPTTMGETLQFSVGRGEQVFGTASCPPAFHGSDVDVVYDDGWGLNTFSFYCVFKGEPPPIPIVDE